MVGGVHQRLHCRQTNDKARTENPFLAALVAGVVARVTRRYAVLRRQPAIMGFDNLLGDRQAKSRVVAEILMRAVGIKPLEDLLDCIWSDAGAVIIDHN